jgi:hypothetical protein
MEAPVEVVEQKSSAATIVRTCHVGNYSDMAGPDDCCGRAFSLNFYGRFH